MTPSTTASRVFHRIMRYKRRPSGCIIQDMPNGYSSVTWIEHVEAEDEPVHGIFTDYVSSGMTFGAKRWLAVLQRQCERLASLLARNISDIGVLINDWLLLLCDWQQEIRDPICRFFWELQVTIQLFRIIRCAFKCEEDTVIRLNEEDTIEKEDYGRIRNQATTTTIATPRRHYHHDRSVISAGITTMLFPHNRDMKYHCTTTKVGVATTIQGLWDRGEKYMTLVQGNRPIFRMNIRVVGEDGSLPIPGNTMGIAVDEAIRGQSYIGTIWSMLLILDLPLQVDIFLTRKSGGCNRNDL
ncbi:hypothetical protein L2E82_40780 [Cichorium intybus]|uniref:Uncharacterized protein n=1 Tax=Cichorium intybus TaxID=13427 RepID=A0ACB9ARB5_CICIN|nr:hypothetical protein L2E82_40780 [Cichorium intybus]